MTRRHLSAALLGLLICSAGAQAPVSPDQVPPSQTAPAGSTPLQAAQAAQQARDLSAQARERSPGRASIDQTLWKQAAQAAELAVQLEPANTEYLALRAGIYTETGFWSRALSSWQAYFAAAGQDAAPQAQAAAAEVHFQLAYAAYGRSDLPQAAALLSECLRLSPQNADCALWAGRLALEQGDFAGAQALYTRAAQLSPENRAARYFSQLAAQAERYGPEATRAFGQAYAELEEGRPGSALQGFVRASQLAPSFAEAHREAGRLALEQGDLSVAQAAYTALAALPGATDADRYNLNLTAEAGQYGLDAVREFRRGYALYTAGDRSGAEAAFRQAAALSPRYAKAWSWLGRVQYESRRYAEAAASYEQAAQLDPADRAAAHFLRLSRAQLDQLD